MRARALSSFLLLSLLAVACGPNIPEGMVLVPKNRTTSTDGAPRPSNLPVTALDWERQPLLVAAADVEGPPLSLTSSEGNGLVITSLSAQAAIQDPLAFTEIHLVFTNPEPRTIEGRFEVTLPPGAAVSRFAMKQDFGWQEGEVVELQAARAAYEDALHRRVDPALLEKQAGNRFQARVFPIPASGTKEIIFSYSQELSRAREPYRLYLRGLPEVGSLDLRVILDKPDGKSPGGLAREALEVHKKSFKPDRDLAIPLPAAASSGSGPLGLRNEDLAVARVTPISEASPDKIESLIVLFDTSASRALGFRAQVDRLGRLVESIQRASRPEVPLAVVGFDQDASTIFNGMAKDFGRRELNAIVDRKPLGASDLGKALRFAGSLTAVGGRKFARALVITDGITTAGSTDAQRLRDDMRGLKSSGLERLDALVDGGIRDEGTLRQIATSVLLRDGIVLDAGLAPEKIAERLSNATVSGIQVKVPGSEWVWPAELNGVQPGDEAVVFAVLPRSSPFNVELTSAQKRQVLPIQASTVERPLLERAAVNAHIKRLERDRSAAPDEAAREQFKQRIIGLSTRYRVLSDFTALLVLESDEDYSRFNIDRSALADILTVGPNGVDLLNRTTPAPSPAIVAAAPPRTTDAEEERGASEKKPSADADDKGSASSRETEKKKADSAAPVAAAPPPPPPPRTSSAPGGGAPAASAAPSQPMAPPKPAEAKSEAPVMPATPRPRPEPESAPAPDRPSPRASGAAGSGPRPPRSAPPGDPMGGWDPPSPAPAATSAPRAQVQACCGPPAQGRRPVDLTDREVDEAPFERPDRRPVASNEDDDEDGNTTAPYEGRLRDVMALIAKKNAKQGLDAALKYREDEPGDVLALVALGEAYEALGDKVMAGRAYGSIIDLFPSRADLRRFAGARLERLGQGSNELAVDTFRHAVEDRPDHPASHRMLAYALVKSGRMEEAFEAILNGLRRRYPDGRFAGVQYILFEDVGLIAAAWIRADPSKKQAILERLARLSVPLPTKPSLRFVLNWETDANDVDFHIHDGRRGHAFYSQPVLRSGGELYADVTTGYGPECFTIEGRPRAYPYRLQAHYYSRGPMGYGMGKLEIIEHDGQGGLAFEERPFVVMTDRAFVDLGVVKGPLPKPSK